VKKTLALLGFIIICIAVIANCSDKSTSIKPDGDPGWSFRIETNGDGDGRFIFQGQSISLSVFLDSTCDYSMDEFELLLTVNDTALNIIDVERGEAIECWEYFEYEVLSNDNCLDSCYGALIRITAKADIDQITGHPSACDGADGKFITPDAEMVKLRFFTSYDRRFECQYIPVRFYWLDCDDNIVSCKSDNLDYISKAVFNRNWINPETQYNKFIPTDGSVDDTDHIYGAFDDCDNDQRESSQNTRVINFINGGIDIACADHIEYRRGDLNLNNVAYETDDYQLFVNYFLYGDSVFTIDPEIQRSLSDINRDHLFLKLADLVYMARIINDDSITTSHLEHNKDTVLIRQSNHDIEISSSGDIGAILLVFEGQADFMLRVNYMDVNFYYDGTNTRVLNHNIGSEFIPAGSRRLLTLTSEATLLSVGAAGYQGSMIHTEIVN